MVWGFGKVKVGKPRDAHTNFEEICVRDFRLGGYVARFTQSVWEYGRNKAQPWEKTHHSNIAVVQYYGIGQIQK